MIAAVVTAAALILCAVTAASAPTWRRHAHEPVRVAARGEGPVCTPRVKR